MFAFKYDDEVLFSHEDEEVVDEFVIEWLSDHLENLYDFSNGWLNEDNYEQFETDFKAEYIVELEI